MDQKYTPIDYAREVVGSDPWASFLGIHIDEVREAFCQCSVKIGDNYLNAASRAHGGLIYSLSDQAFAVACNSTGTQALSVSFNITYIGAALQGSTITAVAEPVKQGKRISVWRIDVHDDQGNHVSTGEGIAYHKLG